MKKDSIHSNMWTEDFRNHAPLDLLEKLPKDELHWQAVQTARLGAIKAFGLMNKQFPDEKLIAMSLDSLLAGKLELSLAKEFSNDTSLKAQALKRLRDVSKLDFYDTPTPVYPPHEGKWRLNIYLDLLSQAFFKNNGQSNLKSFSRSDKLELIRLSEIWSNQLTPFEQCAINWLIRGGSDEIFASIYDDSKCESNSQYDLSSDLFSKLVKAVKSSIRHAPSMLKPFKAYRATSLKINDDVDLAEIYKVGETTKFKSFMTASLNPSCAVANISETQDSIFIYELKTLASLAVFDDNGVNGAKVLVPETLYRLESFDENVVLTHGHTPVSVYRWKEL